MASLVANYGSDDDSDPISDEDTHQSGLKQSTNQTTVQPEESKEQTGKNFLIQEEAADSDSDDESTEELDDNPAKEKLPSPKIAKLKVAGKKKKKQKKTEPIPKTVFKSNAIGSVWLNPYENAEKKKQSVLEKHVKMTEVHIPTGKKAKVCIKFRLTGQCRFGKCCKYSHDIETISTSLNSQKDKGGPIGPKEGNPGRKSNTSDLPPPPKQQGFMGTVKTLQSNSNAGPSRYQERMFRQQERFMSSQDEGEGDDDKFISDKKRKRRVGVSQTLVPPKRALMALAKQREEERPWTVDWN